MLGYPPMRSRRFVPSIRMCGKSNRICDPIFDSTGRATERPEDECHVTHTHISGLKATA
jgi:hypothetical protein